MTFPSSIGTIDLATNWPALEAMFADRLPQDGPCLEGRTVSLTVFLAGEDEPIKLAPDGPADVEPRHIRIGDCAFLLSRDHITGDVPANSPLRGRVLQWLWCILPVLCCPEGWEAIHSAAVATEDGAVLIPGTNNVGKTTRALQLLREGCRLLSDDIVILSAERRVRGWGTLMHLCVDTARSLCADTATLDASGKVWWRPARVAHHGEYDIARVEGDQEADLLIRAKGWDSAWRPEIGAKGVLFPPAERACIPEPIGSGRPRIVLTNRNPHVYEWEGGDMNNLRATMEGLRAAGAEAWFVPSDAEEPPDCDAVLSYHTQFEWAHGPARWGKPLLVKPITFGRPPREEVEPVVNAASRLLCYGPGEVGYYRETFPEEPPEKFTMLPFRGQGVPASIYAEHEEVTPEPRSVLMMGRYQPDKGQEEVLRACKRLDLSVTFVGMMEMEGAGRYLKRLRTLAGEWRGARFFGWMAQGENLWRFYRRAHVHVNAKRPSWGEPFGLVSAEALACGCNIVHTAFGWASDLFAEYGTTCDPTDANALAEAIRSEAAAPRDRHGFRPPTWEQAARYVLEAIEEVLGEHVHR